MDRNPSTDAVRIWDKLAQSYAKSRQLSADQLIEWPAQLAMCGDLKGLRILDVGCGTGDKARFFAMHGALSVLGVDPSRGFARNWEEQSDCPNLSFAISDFRGISESSLITSQTFDLIVSFQSLMYASDLNHAMHALRGLLAPGGNIVISVPHPFRFAVLKHEIEDWGLGYAYQQTDSYRYPSPWKDDISLEHATPRVSDYMNAVARAGLRIEEVDEPAPTPALRELAPEKAAWMDRYVGIMIFRARAE